MNQLGEVEEELSPKETWLAAILDSAAEISRLGRAVRTQSNMAYGDAELLQGLDFRKLDLKPELRDAQRQRVEAFRGAVANLLMLVNHYLDLSNIEAGQFELEMIDFDLKWVLEQTLAGVAAGAAAKELVLKLVLVPGIPRTVAGDAVRLRQILANLLNNAVEFAEAGEIRLMAEAPEANACHVHFGIRFCAGGWPEGRHEKVNSCRVLLRQMGGELALLREDDQRLVFTFDLKFTPCSREKGPTAPLPDKPEGQAHGIRILIAEDSEDSRFLLQEFLKRGPYEVTFAENGKLALEAALTQTFDLILMDIQMPVMDGLTATRLIREAEAREGRAVTPLLALTAHTRKADIELSIAAGCNAHISKPISKVGLLETIQKYSPARQMPVEAIA